MQQLRRLTAIIAVGAVLVGCTVTESSRSEGLVPPTGPVPTATTPTATVVTVTVRDGLASPSTDGLPEGSHETTTSESAPAPAAADASFTTDIDVSSADTSPATAPPPPAIDPLEHARQVLAAADPLEGFREGVLGVSGPAGSQAWPVIIADTPQARQRGLMGVEDFSALGGYAAMVFIFEEDTSGAFWMRNTPLPLRITFVAADGSVVSVADMVPCLPPTPAGECENYSADGPYRIAIEHPVGPEFDLGLADATLLEVTVE